MNCRTTLLLGAALPCAAALALACGGDQGGGGSSDAADSDLSSDSADAANSADAAGDTGPQPNCGWEPADHPTGEQRKFSLALFHFNLQYVIGGLEYLDADGKSHTPLDQSWAKGWDNDRVEDWIITETFAPILDLYEAHPGWGVNIELQAYMIEVIAARFPDVLDQLRRLASRGQVELVSFHYADQLFLAYPREDLERSIARTREVFAENCLPLSPVVFNQEGQAGEGRQQMLVDQGYGIGVFPKNLFKYVRAGEAWQPLYQSRGGKLIVGPGAPDPASGIDVAWSFFDDGELRAVPEGMNPYFAPLGGYDAARVADFEATLAAQEAQGYEVTTISDYVRHVEALGVPVPEAPPLLDGTWQPPSTDSIHRWLGGASQMFYGEDEDNAVRAGNAAARMHVAATQVLAEHAEAEGVGLDAAGAESLALLWENLWHAEVSDCSGVNPWRGEVRVCLQKNAWLQEQSAALRDQLLDALGYPHVAIDLEARTALRLDDVPMAEPHPVVDAPMELTIRADGRAVDEVWREKGDEHWEVTLSFPAPEGPCGACQLDLIEVGFPRTEDVIAYSPGLIEDEVVQYPLSDFSFQLGEVWLPLANGLIGLGDDTWVIKHTRVVHMAARVAPERATIDFVDETADEEGAHTWAFDLFRGSAEEALALANRLNIGPRVIY